MPEMSKNSLSCHLDKLSVRTFVILLLSLVWLYSPLPALYCRGSQKKKVLGVFFYFILFYFYRALICFTSVFDCRKARKGENGSIHSKAVGELFSTVEITPVLS